jgi:hypothetical protein
MAAKEVLTFTYSRRRRKEGSSVPTMEESWTLTVGVRDGIANTDCR